MDIRPEISRERINFKKDSSFVMKTIKTKLIVEQFRWGGFKNSN